MNESKVAYSAGIIDGEGCLQIQRYCRTLATGTVSVRYDARISVKMTHRPTLLFLKNTFGCGNVLAQKKGLNKQTWCWAISNRDAFLVIKQIFPYLITKKEEAVVMLAYEPLSHRVGFGGKPVPTEITNKRDGFYLKMRVLKQKEFTT